MSDKLLQTTMPLLQGNSFDFNKIDVRCIGYSLQLIIVIIATSNQVE